MKRLSYPYLVLFGSMMAAAVLSLVAPYGYYETTASSQSISQTKLSLVLPETGPANGITSLAYSPDGSMLASSSADGTIRLWLTDAGITIKTLNGHTGSIDSIAFSPDGRLLASGGRDKVIKLWDVASGKESKTLAGHDQDVSDLQFSPDGKLLASASWDKSIKLWDIATGKELRRMFADAEWTSIAFDPGGEALAAADAAGKVRLWGVASGHLIKMFQGHSDLVGTVAFSSDGRTLATGSLDNTIKLWDVETGKELKTFIGHSSAVSSIAFSADGKVLVSGGEDKTVKLWDVETGQLLRSLKDQSQGVTSVAFSPDGTSLASGSRDRTIDVWSVSDGSLQKTLKGHAHQQSSVAVSPDATQLASGSSDNTIKIWDLKRGGLTRSLHGHTNAVLSVAFSPTGRALASGSADNTVRLWDVATGAEARSLAGHSSLVSSVAFSPDGKTLASASWDMTIKLWDMASGSELRSLKGHSDRISSVAFSPDGKTLASGSYDNIKLWDVVSGSELRSLKGYSVRSVAFSPNGKTLASGSRDNTIKLWDVASGNELRSLKAHATWVSSVVFSPDGKTLASGSFDDTIKLWDVVSGSELRSLKAHGGWVTSVVFIADGKTLASVSNDGTIKLWDVLSGRNLATLIAVDDKDWIVVDDQLRVDASVNSQRLMYWSLGDDLISFDQLKERYYEPGLLAKVSGVSKEPLRDVSKVHVGGLYPHIELEPIAVGTNKLTVRLKNQGGGIGRIQVFVNGKEYLEDARDERLKRDPNLPEAVLTIDLSKAPVVSDNLVRVVSWNLENYVVSRGAEIVWHVKTAANQRPPEFYAIVAGISDYAGKNLNLRYAARDADAMAHALELGAARLFGKARVHITLLSTSGQPGTIAPTKANFKQAFDSAAKRAQPDDELVVYLAGQGLTGGGAADTYFYLTQEANVISAESLSDSQLRTKISLSSEELAQWIKLIPALKQVLILDTCGAGGAASKLLEKRDIPADVLRALNRLRDRTGTWLLMGSAADAVSYESTQYGGGLLTHALLEGMRGAALRENTFIDVATLFQYAQNRVPYLAKAVGGIQRPIIFAPAQSNSFDIGMLTAEDRANIRLSAPKPLVLRPTLLHDTLAYDDLRITPSVRDTLMKESFASTTAKPGGRIVFIDTDEMSSAIRPTGIYSIDGSNVRLTLRLIRDNKVFFSININGTSSDIKGFIERVTETIIRESVTIEKKSSLRDKNESKMNVSRAARMSDAPTAGVQSQHHAHRPPNLHHYRFVETGTRQNESFVSSDLLDGNLPARIRNQNRNVAPLVVVRPVIHNVNPERGDDLKLQAHVVKGLKAWSDDKDDPVSIEFKDIDNLHGAYKLEGIYERSAKGYLRLSLIVRLNGVVIAQPTPSVCDSDDKMRIADLLVEMAHLALSSLPLGRGAQLISAADLKVLNYRLRSYALLIATNDYDEDTGWQDLDNPICDAEAIKKELVEHYGFDEKEEVFTAYNQDYDGVWNSIDAFHKKVYPADSDTALFVFIAGHGTYDEQRKKGMLAARNARVSDPKGNNYYRFTNLLEDISALPLKHIFVVIDACQSGDAINDSTDRGDPNVRSDVEFLIDRLAKPTRKAFTSASYNNVSDGFKDEHSPFAQKLLDAFRKYGSNDRFLTIDEIWTLGGMDRLKTNPRHGWFKGNAPGSDFLLIAQPKVRGYKCLAECKCN